MLLDLLGVELILLHQEHHESPFVLLLLLLLEQIILQKFFLVQLHHGVELQQFLGCLGLRRFLLLLHFFIHQTFIFFRVFQIQGPLGPDSRHFLH